MTTTAPANRLEDARACLRHYADEIRESIEDTGRAPVELERYTCGADYQHEANIDPALFWSAIQRINLVACYGMKGEQLREVIDLVIRNV